MALKLFGGPRTRASMPRWFMEEKAIDYELVELDLQSKQHRHPDFLGINPFGKLPALIDSDVLLEVGSPLKLFESGSILLHLAETYSGDVITPSQRALTSQWLLFTNANLPLFCCFPPVVILNFHTSWRCSIVNWILNVPWLAIAGVRLTSLFRPISVTCHCFSRT